MFTTADRTHNRSMDDYDELLDKAIEMACDGPNHPTVDEIVSLFYRLLCGDVTVH